MFSISTIAAWITSVALVTGLGFAAVDLGTSGSIDVHDEPSIATTTDLGTATDLGAIASEFGSSIDAAIDGGLEAAVGGSAAIVGLDSMSGSAAVAGDAAVESGTTGAGVTAGVAGNLLLDR